MYPWGVLCPAVTRKGQEINRNENHFQMIITGVHYSSRDNDIYIFGSNSQLSSQLHFQIQTF